MKTPSIPRWYFTSPGHPRRVLRCRRTPRKTERRTYQQCWSVHVQATAVYHTNGNALQVVVSGLVQNQRPAAESGTRRPPGREALRPRYLVCRKFRNASALKPAWRENAAAPPAGGLSNAALQALWNHANPGSSSTCTQRTGSREYASCRRSRDEVRSGRRSNRRKPPVGDAVQIPAVVRPCSPASGPGANASCSQRGWLLRSGGRARGTRESAAGIRATLKSRERHRRGCRVPNEPARREPSGRGR